MEQTDETKSTQETIPAASPQQPPLFDIESVFMSEGVDLARLFEARREIFLHPDLQELMDAVVTSLEGAVAKAEKPSERRDWQTKLGYGLWVQGDYAGAATALKEAVANPVAAYILGLLYLEEGDNPAAVEILEKAAGKDDRLELQCALLEAKTKTGRADQVLKTLEGLGKAHGSSAEVHYQRGLALDYSGEYEAALSAYQEALTLDGRHAKSAFRMAYGLALRGQEEDALPYYQQCLANGLSYQSVLMNLGVLYEDARQYEKAVKCYEQVIRANPTDERARLYLKDAVASLHMYYDEDRQREMERRKTVLALPINDFELSVRARTALESIGAQTLGDLVLRTEQELLGMDNFGETSLHEIKTILTQHGLHLGMSLQEPAPAPASVVSQPGGENVLDRLVADLELSVRARRCMERLGIVTLRDLTEKTERELLSGKNFGRTSLKEIKDKLAAFGLQLAEEK